MRTLRSFFRILDRHTAAVTGLSLLSTWLCLRYEILADLPSALIGVAIIFPIVFSINSAYRRREEVLKHLASAKGHAIAIAWAHRDWTGGDADHARRGRVLVEDLFATIREFFQRRSDPPPEALADVYAKLAALSRSHEELRASGVPANEVSRINQYLRAIVIDFERMRNVLEYRTPQSLRAYSRVFLNAFPVLFGPYFARLATESSLAVGYLVAITYSVVLVSLDNVQEDLENPYDMVGADDVRLDLSDEISRLLGAERPDLGPGTSRGEEGILR